MEWIEEGKLRQRGLREALLDVARADETYIAFKDEWKTLIDLMHQVKEHSLNDPRSKIVNRYKKIPRVIKACHTARLNALKTGLNFVSGIDWKIQRLKNINEPHGREVDAELFRWFFSTHVRRFKEFNKEELSGITMPELPPALKKRL